MSHSLVLWGKTLYVKHTDTDRHHAAGHVEYIYIATYKVLIRNNTHINFLKK